jgi:hypothetical protein
MNVKTLFVVSLVVNLALATTIAWMAKSHSARSTETKTASTTQAAAKSTIASKAKPAASDAAVSPAAPAQSFDWRLVESEDYKKYIANLRAIGCPEETIRDIITADVNKLYESKRKELAGPKKKFEFWKPGGLMGAAIDPERMEKERALNKEKRALLTELLGSAPDEKPDILAGAASQLEAMFDFLPAEKRSKVFELMQDMQTKMQKATKSGGFDGEDYRKATKETEAAMAAILTPEEMLDYNLRFSMTANMMRMQLAGFEPKEQEFLEIFKKRKAYDDEFGVSGMGGLNLKGEEKQKQKAAEQELDKQINGMLGEDRYQDYKRAQDYAFQSMYRVADREGLGKDAAVKVYDMKKIAEEQARKVRQDKSLTKEQRTAALQGIRTETENSVRVVFGDKGFQSYQKQPAAHWLNSISPEPKKPTE